MVTCSNDYYRSSASNLRQIYYILSKLVIQISKISTTKLQCDAQTTDEKPAAQLDPSATFFVATLLCLILEDTQVDDVVQFPLE